MVSPRVIISDERARILDSGGGVLKALPHLGTGPFYVLNADAIWIDGPRPSLQRLAEHWDPETMDILLLLAHSSTATGWATGAISRWTRTAGCAAPGGRRSRPSSMRARALEAELFAGRPEIFSLNKLFDEAAEKGRLHASGSTAPGCMSARPTPSPRPKRRRTEPPVSGRGRPASQCPDGPARRALPALARRRLHGRVARRALPADGRIIRPPRSTCQRGARRGRLRMPSPSDAARAVCCCRASCRSAIRRISRRAPSSPRKKSAGIHGRRDLPPAIGDLGPALPAGRADRALAQEPRPRALAAAGDGFQIGGGFADSFALAGDLARLMDEFTIEGVNWSRSRT